MSDIAGLKAKLKADVISAVQGEVAEAAHKAMREAINDTMYASGGGAYYSRTGDFLNAIAIEDRRSSGNSTEFKVIVKGSMLSPNFTGTGWNQHMDVRGHSWNGDGIVEVLDEGTNAGLYAHKGYHFYDKAESDMDVKLIGVLAKALSGRGWDVQIV